MELPSFLANLLIPLDLCIALLGLGAVLRLFRLRRAGNFSAVLGLAWALAWSLPITSIWLGGELEQRYPHLTPTEAPKAEAIVEYRKANGPFKSADELALVKGIGLKTVERNRDLIAVGGARQAAPKAKPAAPVATKPVARR